jgi:hypothetical protein
MGIENLPQLNTGDLRILFVNSHKPKESASSADDYTLPESVCRINILLPAVSQAKLSE